ncbi:snRNA-activating protein complex subunit 3-like isoform X1 [Haemaphysalis longicornis]
METVHEPSLRSWVGERIKVAEFKQNWMKVLKEFSQSEDDGDMRKALMRRMNISQSALKSLEDDCGPSQLCCGEETMDATEIPEDVGLMTLKLQKKDLLKRKDVHYRTKTNRFLHKTCVLSNMNAVPVPPSSEACLPEERVAPGEVVLVVQVYKPMRPPPGSRKMRMAGCLSYKIQAEIAVLGCQKLRSLRTKISCISDAALVGDFSESTDDPVGPRASDLYKSGFFYIGDTFYNDMSDPSCKDYSQVIIDWAKNPRRKVGPFKTARMEESTFDDLELRLGYPYVYVHQGYCEHLMVFSDMRVIHPSDSQNVMDYPIVLKTFPFGKRVLCMLCKQSTCTWVVYENDRLTDDPFFLCKVCHTSFNYTADKKKIGHFRAQPFLDWNAVL